MKILIAYDGSESADKGIDGLLRAGLPAEADALVISVAEVWLPPALKLVREHAARILEEARELAERGSERVRHLFPHWTVGHEAMSGSAANELLNRAEEWHPDLIIVGSHGRTALGRLVLGSVSQRVLTEARTSVRVSRQAKGTGAAGERILIGCDGSAGSRAAVRAVAARNWASGSEVRVIVVEDLRYVGAASLLTPSVGELVDEGDEAGRTQAEDIAAEAVKDLHTGLGGKDVTVSSTVDTGNPKRVLVRQAEEFGTDCIFTGATGFSNRIERFVLGSVSAAVAARAHCSVEVVRSYQ